METLNKGLPKIGYLFHYPQLDHPTDTFRLDIYLSSIPTEKHFDVKTASFIIQSEEEGFNNMTVSHPWGFENSAKVCAGLVVMTDRHGKKVEAFSFGGKLTIKSKENQTLCTLASHAPILELSSATPMHKLFVEEVEIALAKYRADFPVHTNFEKILCNENPFNLYLTCLTEITTKFESFSRNNDTYMDFLIYLRSEYHRLEAVGLTKGDLPPLKEIFKTN